MIDKNKQTQFSTEIITKKNDKINLLEYFFPWMIILGIYRIGPVSISDILLLCLVMLSLIQKWKIQLVSKYFIILCLLVVFQSIGAYIVYGNIQILKNLFSVMISMFLIVSLPSFIQINNLYKTYKIPAVLTMIGVVIQSYSIYLKKQLVSPILIFPSIVSSENIVSNSNRPVSFFSEPQAIATFLLPIFILSIRKKDYLWTFAIAAIIILSGSSLGIIVYSLILLISNLNIMNSKPNKKMVIIIAVVSVIIFSKFDDLNFILEKIQKIDYKTDLRLANGWLIFKELPIISKFTGIGIGNISYFLNSHDIPHISVYATSIAGTLISFGIFISFYYFYFLLKQLSILKKEKKLFLIALIILSFGQTIFFNMWFTLFMVIIFVDRIEVKA